MMQLWVFSDLHLREPSERIYQSFLKALQQPQGPGDFVLIAGDCFDLWVGSNPALSKIHQDLLDQLSSLVKRSVWVGYIEGNHDFHLRNVLEPIGIQMISDCWDYIDPANGLKLHVAHGDLVDQDDFGYQALRTVFRSTVVRTLVNWVPQSLVSAIADQMSRGLEMQISTLPEMWPAAEREKLRQKFHTYARSTGADRVILGHCHDLDQVPPLYFNMGYPRVHLQYCYYESATGQIIRRAFE